MREIERLCGDLKFGNIAVDAFIARTLEIICRQVDCSRTGLWLFSRSAGERGALRCVGMYDRRDDRMIPAATSWTDADEGYFAELAAHGKVVASDVREHPVTSRHFDSYFRKQDIRSFLAVSCSLNGRICGAFTCSSIGTAMEWSGGQISTLSKISARATVALADQFPAASHVATLRSAADGSDDDPRWGCF